MVTLTSAPLSVMRRSPSTRTPVVEGTREGLDATRARGRTGGRKPKLNARQAATVRRMYEAAGPDGKRQHTVAEIAEAVGVHRTTVYDYLNKGQFDDDARLGAGSTQSHVPGDSSLTGRSPVSSARLKVL